MKVLKALLYLVCTIAIIIVIDPIVNLLPFSELTIEIIKLVLGFIIGYTAAGIYTAREL